MIINHTCLIIIMRTTTAAWKYDSMGDSTARLESKFDKVDQHITNT